MCPQNICLPEGVVYIGTAEAYVLVQLESFTKSAVLETTDLPKIDNSNSSASSGLYGEHAVKEHTRCWVEPSGKRKRCRHRCRFLLWCSLMFHHPQHNEPEKRIRCSYLRTVNYLSEKARYRLHLLCPILPVTPMCAIVWK